MKSEDSESSASLVEVSDDSEVSGVSGVSDGSGASDGSAVFVVSGVL